MEHELVTLTDEELREEELRNLTDDELYIEDYEAFLERKIEESDF